MLDEVDGLLKFELSGVNYCSPSLLQHLRVALLSHLYCVVSRVRIARSRMRVLRLLLQNDLVFDNVRVHVLTFP